MSHSGPATPLVVWLDEIDLGRRRQVGGKAAGLARLLALGLPVPPGFCVTADAWRAGGGALAGAPRAEVVAAWERLAGDRDVPVAVRSSATCEDGAEHSFAGQHDTVLGVRGADACCAAIERCWASLHGERAVRYRARHGIPDDGVAMAVVVQRQVPAEVSGVLFSVDPVEGRRDRIVIEACAGLGEALVSGRVTPARWTLSRPGLEVVSHEAGSGPLATGEDGALLPDARAAALGRLALRIEEHWGVPVDVEWAVAGGAIALLQARAVTALAGPLAPAGDGTDDAWEARQVWTNVNTGEVAPDVTTPLGWDVVEPIATRLLGVFFDMAGVEVAGHRVLGLVGGRVYFNLNTVLGLLRRLPGMKDRGVLQLFGGEEEAPPELGELDIPDEDIPEARHSVVGMLWHAPALVWGLLRFPRGGAQRVVARLRREADELAARPLDGVDDRGLAGAIAETIEHVQGDTGAFRATAFATMMPTGLYQLCSKWFGADGNATASRLLGGLGDTETAESGLALWRLAAHARRSPPLAELLRGGGGPDAIWPRLDEVEGGGEFRRAWDAFLARHGHHCRAELELSNPRWAEEPGPLLDQLRSYLDGFDQRDLEAHYRQVARRREQTEAECRAALRGPVKRLLFRLIVDAAQRTAPYRETIKSQVIRKLMVLRRQLLEAGRRLRRRGVLDAADDVFYLRLAELDALLRGTDDAPSAVRESVAERRAERASFQRCTPPPVLRGRYDPERLVWADPVDDGDGLLRGIAVNPGVVVGPARVILRAGDDQVRPGEILVAPFTDPGWTPYFLNAGAIVMDLGGVLSHGSIIARELGIPAVVNVDRATRRIRTGQRLEVDGTRGTVRVLDASPAEAD